MPIPVAIVHICEKSAWEEAQALGEYRPCSLQQEGFIHASRPEQVLKVANRFYRGTPGLVLLWIDLNLLHVELRWETVEAEIYPHLYGPLNLDSVFAVKDLILNADGTFCRLPDL